MTAISFLGNNTAEQTRGAPVKVEWSLHLFGDSPCLDTEYLERSHAPVFGVTFWNGVPRPIRSFDEFVFLLAVSIWSTFNELIHVTRGSEVGE